MFGPHMTLDLVGCDVAKLKSLQLHFDLLNDIPHLIGMTPITAPYVFPYSGLIPEDSGITGIAIIAESHISVHSFDKKEYCFIDIFSCKPFNTETALNHIINVFEPKSYTFNVIERGHNFPR